MKKVILNLMITSMVGCWVEGDVFASNYSEAWIQYARNSSSKQRAYPDKSVIDTKKSSRSSNNDQATVPLPPPLPSIGMGVPPPPPMMGVTATVQYVSNAEFESKVIEFWNSFSKSSRIGLFRKFINLWLQANKEKISESLSEGIKSAKKLITKSDEYLKILKEAVLNLKESEKKEVYYSFINLLKHLKTYLEKLTSKEYKEAVDPVKNYRIYKNMIQGVARQYFEQARNTVSVWKKDSLSVLQNVQSLVDGALVLSDSFYDLVKLSKQDSVSFSDDQMGDVTSIFELRELILKRLSVIRDAEKDVDHQESLRSVIILPTGDEISEQKYLSITLDCIEKIFNGESDNISILLDLKDLLMDGNTSVKSNINSSYDPMEKICKLNDSVLNVDKLFKRVVDDFEISSYSQFTKPFKSSGRDCDGGGLTSSVSKFIELANLPELMNSDVNKIRIKLKGKKVKGDIVSMYIRLFPLLFSDRGDGKFKRYVIDTITKQSQKQFFPSSFSANTNITSNQKALEKKESLVKFMCETEDGNFVENVLDYRDGVILSTMIKNFNAQVDRISQLAKDIERTPKVIEKIHKVFGEEMGDNVGYINRCLNRYLKFDLSFEIDKDNRIQINLLQDKSGDESKKKSIRKLSRDDIPNLLYAYALNRDLVEKSKMFMIATSRNLEEDKASILDVIDRFSDALEDVVVVLENQNKNGALNGLIAKVKALQEPMKKSAKNRFHKVGNKVKNALTFIRNSSEAVTKKKRTNEIEEATVLQESIKENGALVPQNKTNQVGNGKLSKLINKGKNVVKFTKGVSEGVVKKSIANKRLRSFTNNIINSRRITAN